MFSYTIEAALQSNLIDRLVISSDDLVLKPLAEAYNIEFVQRPVKLATATAALDDGIRDVCRRLHEHDGFMPDVIIIMLGNIPVRKEHQIDEVISRFTKLPTATAICTASQVRLRPEWAKVLSETEEALPFISGSMPYRKQDLPQLYMLDGAVMGVRTNTLFNTEDNKAAHAWLGKHIHMIVQEHPMYSLEVDYEDEVPLAVFYLLYKKYGSNLLKKLETKFLE